MNVFYNKTISDLFRHTEHGAKFNNEPDSMTVSAGNLAHGDIMEIQVSIRDKKINSARFKAQGKMTTIATAEFLCQTLESKTLAQLTAITHQTLNETLQLPSHRISAAILAEDAINAIRQAWENKK